MKINIKSINFYLFLLIGLSCLGNYYKLNLFFGVDFLFGSIFVWMIALLYGRFWAILAGILASSVTYILWGHPYATIIFILEIIFVTSRYLSPRKNIVLGDILYWLFLGIPLISVFYGLILPTSQIETILIALKQPINGIFNLLVATLIINIFNSNPRLPSPKIRNTLSFKQNIFNLLLIFIFIPTLSLTIINGNEAIHKLEAKVITQLQRTNNEWQSSFNNWYDIHFNLISKFDQRSLNNPELLESQLQTLINVLSDIDIIIISDRQGEVIASKSSLDANMSSLVGKSFKDSDEFQQAKQTKKKVTRSAGLIKRVTVLSSSL